MCDQQMADGLPVHIKKIAVTHEIFKMLSKIKK